MKLCLLMKRNQAWTLIEVVLVIAVLAVLAAMFLPVMAAAKRRAQRINCVSNVKQLNLAFRVWEGDNNNQYPMSVSATNGGAVESPVTANVAGYFQVMSNRLANPDALICPLDREHTPATNFQSDFNNSHISYFVNPDAAESYPQEVTLGDDNLAINGVAVKSGVLEIPCKRADFLYGRTALLMFEDIYFADGSIAELSTAGLQSALALATNGTPNIINRLAIP